MKYYTSLFLFFISTFLFANNIQINEVTIVSQDTNDDFYMVEFDLSWENSWRTSTLESNWDAAWVFLKATVQNQQEWAHGVLNYVDGSNDGHVAAPGCRIETVVNSNNATRGVGVLIYRDSDGIGNNNFENIQLRWNYGTSGFGDNDVIDISVNAIEMVYVPRGAFYLGDRKADFGQFELGDTGEPFLVSSEAQLTLGGSSPLSLGNHNAINMLNGDDFDDNTAQTLPLAFPKGYEDFYCMKYEVSQGQYASFLQHLTETQKQERDGPHYVNAVNVFPVKDGNSWAEADHPWRAMDYISWADMAAYLDWAGLRPMSELEFEKACRGPLQPIEDELAWGNTSWYINGLFEIANVNTNTEYIYNGLGEHTGNANANSIYSGAEHPMRCGIFAASAQNKTREETGATYWGIMEMTGNCYEMVISVGNSQTRDFSGIHGDGVITSSGNASFYVLTDWAFVSGVGTGYRTSEVSTRYSANLNNGDRLKWLGIRGVRTAP